MGDVGLQGSKETLVMNLIKSISTIAMDSNSAIYIVLPETLGKAGGTQDSCEHKSTGGGVPHALP